MPGQWTARGSHAVWDVGERKAESAARETPDRRVPDAIVPGTGTRTLRSHSSRRIALTTPTFRRQVTTRGSRRTAAKTSFLPRKDITASEVKGYSDTIESSALKRTAWNLKIAEITPNDGRCKGDNGESNK